VAAGPLFLSLALDKLSRLFDFCTRSSAAAGAAPNRLREHPTGGRETPLRTQVCRTDWTSIYQTVQSSLGGRNQSLWERKCRRRRDHAVECRAPQGLRDLSLMPRHAADGDSISRTARASDWLGEPLPKRTPTHRLQEHPADGSGIPRMAMP
jgi:hypothetical protein